jgi:hypothetical protein
MINTNYKKGGEKLLSIWWFFVLAIVGGGIVIGVYMYYGADVDVRGVEASVLSKRIVGCIIGNGFLDEDVLNPEFNIYEKCNLGQEALSDSYFFKVKFLDESQKELRQVISGGNPSFEKDCEITEKVKAKKYPKCFTTKENFLYFNNGIKNGILEIITASNNYGKEVFFEE